MAIESREHLKSSWSPQIKLVDSLHHSQLVPQQTSAAVDTKMPLTERDINTQRDVSHTKRLSGKPDLAFVRMNDENSPSLRGSGSKVLSKVPSPSQRLLAPTKASAGKLASSPRLIGHITPQTQSKLPRRALTPSTAPPISKWSLRVAERVASTEEAAMEGEILARQRVETLHLHSHQAVSRASTLYPYTLLLLTTAFCRKATRQ